MSEGNPLRRNLLVAAVVAVVLPLLVVLTALTGFAKVRSANAESITLLQAQRYQQDADMMHDAIHADVLAALVDVRTGASRAAPSTAPVTAHVHQLGNDISRLEQFDLSASLAAPIDGVTTALEQYGAQATRLVTLAGTDPRQAHAQLATFEQAFHDLEGPQARLTTQLGDQAVAANASAHDIQADVERWTEVVAAATLAALLLLAFALHRLGSRQTALLARLDDSAATLASANDQLETAQHMAQIGSWQWTPATDETTWSAELYGILGLSPDEPGRHHDLFLARVHPEDRDRVRRERAAVLDGSADEISEHRIVRPDGTVREVRAQAKPMRDSDGRLTKVVGTLQDVTERRIVERMKDEFVSVISHELRTPLTSIRGALGLLASGSVGVLPDKAQRMADVAMSSSERLVRLINDILDVEKMTAGKLTLDLAPLAVDEILSATAEEMRAMAVAAGVTIVARPSDAVVWADGDRVAQTLTNLLSNAVKFSPPGSTVTVAARVESEFAHVTVTDEGRGIPADKLETVFDRFAQVDASDTRVKGGTGLGLPICRGIVEQHGGRIWATSVEGEGTTFEFTLPLSATPGVWTADGPLPTGAVLICDDDPEVVEVLAAMLEAHGYPTLRAHGGQQAVELATQQAPSLILMDLRMPGMSGWETIGTLADNPATADIPVVILSALGPDETVGPPASDWLTKPVDDVSLLASLRRTLGAEETTSALVVEDDPELGEVLVTFFSEHGVQARVAATGGAAITMSAQAPPDLLVLDLGLPDIDGYAVVDALRRDERLRSLPMIVYSGADLNVADRSRLRLGETRFVAKGSGSPDDFERQVVSLLRTITAPTPV